MHHTSGETIKLDRDQLDRIPREALEQCANEEESAVQDTMKAIPDSKLFIERDNVAAKMRIAAQERLMYRLEAGETPKTDNDSGLGLDKMGARYIYCARLAINHKLEGIYVGQDLTAEIGVMPEDQIEGYFRSIGRSSCPISFQSYSKALDNAIRISDQRAEESDFRQLGFSEN